MSMSQLAKVQNMTEKIYTHYGTGNCCEKPRGKFMAQEKPQTDGFISKRYVTFISKYWALIIPMN